MAFAALNLVIAELRAVSAESFSPDVDPGAAFEGIFAPIAELFRSIAKTIVPPVEESAALAQLSGAMQGRLQPSQEQLSRFQR